MRKFRPGRILNFDLTIRGVDGIAEIGDDATIIVNVDYETDSVLDVLSVRCETSSPKFDTRVEISSHHRVIDKLWRDGTLDELAQKESRDLAGQSGSDNEKG